MVINQCIHSIDLDYVDCLIIKKSLNIAAFLLCDRGNCSLFAEFCVGLWIGAHRQFVRQGGESTGDKPGRLRTLPTPGHARHRPEPHYG